MRADLQAPLSSVLVRVRPRVLGGLCLGAALVACAAPRPSHHLAEPEAPRAVLVLHGGAGTIDRASMTPELEQDYRAAREGALRAGHAVLASGGSAMDAVEATLLPLEDSPLFNAGRGAVLTADRLCELDASVMDGGTGLAGAVAGIRTVRHPIRAARVVMEKSEHVLLAGRGADAFAAEQGPLGYALGYFMGGVDGASLNLVYNLADFLNKIAFGVIIWNVAVTESEAK